MRQVLGWVFVLAVANGIGCGSSKNPGDGGAGSAGTAGQAGASGTGGSAGSTGAGGAAGATGGAAGGASGGGGAAGSGPAVGCPDGTVAPTSPTIADFTPVGDGGASIEIMGGTTSFGTPSPEVILTGGNLHAQVTVVAGDEPQTVGFGVYFRGCVNAAAYSGVKFDMSGTVIGCAMSYAFNFSEDAWNPSLVDAGTDGDTKGACTLGPTACYPPTATITAANQTVLFSAVSGGAPAHTVDKSRLTGLLWQFEVAARPDGGPNSACSVDLTIDNIVFVP